MASPFHTKLHTNQNAAALCVRHQEPMTESTVLDQLVGEQLSAVTFVQDYLQLWFDGPGLNITNPLTVSSEDGQIASWEEGFRDLLCGQIAKIVSSVVWTEGEAIEIVFTDKSSLSVSLRPDDYRGPEAIYGHGFKGDVGIVA